MGTLPTLDSAELRDLTKPGSAWAKACGTRVRARRETLRFSRAQVAQAAGSTEMTVHRIESGALVPRDYLRLALALTLFCEVDELWPPLSREQAVEATA